MGTNTMQCNNCKAKFPLSRSKLGLVWYPDFSQRLNDVKEQTALDEVQFLAKSQIWVN